MSDTPTTPTTPTFESAWYVEARYAPDGAEARVPFRAAHIARLRELQAVGTIVEVGAFPDVSASVLIVRAPDEATVREILRTDVYTQNGVWVEFRVAPFNRLVPAAS